MPTVQTAFPLRQDAGQHGAAAMSRYESDSKVAQAPVRFGAPVKDGTLPGGVVEATDATIVGFAFRSKGRQVADGASYPQGSPLAFMEKGHLFVNTAGAVAMGDPVYFVTATNTYTNAAGAGAIGPFVGWKCEYPTTAAALSVIVRR